MQTIYWLQVIGSFSTVVRIFTTMLLIAFITLAVYRYVELDSRYEKDEIMKCHKRMRNIGVGMVVCLLGSCFIPTEKQLYVIYGIGGTIDYIKSNDTAKQLPDKVVNALDAWLSKQTDEDSK